MTQDDEMSEISLAAIETVGHRLGLNKISSADARGRDRAKLDEKVEAIDGML